MKETMFAYMLERIFFVFNAQRTIEGHLSDPTFYELRNMGHGH
jgi:hypothetical protein